jgi:hypothetical protein
VVVKTCVALIFSAKHIMHMHSTHTDLNNFTTELRGCTELLVVLSCVLLYRKMFKDWGEEGGGGTRHNCMHGHDIGGALLKLNPILQSIWEPIWRQRSRGPSRGNEDHQPSNSIVRLYIPYLILLRTLVFVSVTIAVQCSPETKFKDDSRT